MADDALEDDEVKDDGGVAPMISKRGWLVVVGVVLLEAAIFSILFFAHSGTDSTKQDVDDSKAGYQIPAEYRNQFNVELKDLNYSVPGPSGDTVTLSMIVDVQLGLLQEELGEKGEGKRPSLEQMDEFKKVVLAMDADIRSFLLSKVSSIPLSQLKKNEGRERITTSLQEYINLELGRTKFPNIN
ncbi:MAG: hypothetical protein ACYTGH_14495, partial [Planctomycetota bacterium]